MQEAKVKQKIRSEEIQIEVVERRKQIEVRRLNSPRLQSSLLKFDLNKNQIEQNHHIKDPRSQCCLQEARLDKVHLSAQRPDSSCRYMVDVGINHVPAGTV